MWDCVYCGLVFIRQVELFLYLLGLLFGLFLYVCLFVCMFLCLFVGLFLCVCATGTGTCDGLPSAREGEGSVYIVKLSDMRRCTHARLCWETAVAQSQKIIPARRHIVYCLFVWFLDASLHMICAISNMAIAVKSRMQPGIFRFQLLLTFIYKSKCILMLC
jgi:hypothetical protein